jgi:hypothetical protein
MADQDVMDLAVLECIVGWQNRAARVAEHGGDVFALQTFPKDLGSGLGHKFHYLNVKCFVVGIGARLPITQRAIILAG